MPGGIITWESERPDSGVEAVENGIWRRHETLHERRDRAGVDGVLDVYLDDGRCSWGQKKGPSGGSAAKEKSSDAKNSQAKNLTKEEGFRRMDRKPKRSSAAVEKVFGREENGVDREEKV